MISAKNIRIEKKGTMSNHTLLLSLDEIEKLFASIPRLNIRSISWASSPAIVARIVADILSTTEMPVRKVHCGSLPIPRNVRMRAIANKLKIHESTLRFFVSGFKVGSRMPWVELRNELTKLGANWLGKEEETKIETTEKPIIRRQGEVIPHTPVVMESNGQVVAITPISPPNVMAAKPGDFARREISTKTHTRMIENGDLEVTTTTIRVVKMGSPEYIALLRATVNGK